MSHKTTSKSDPIFALIAASRKADRIHKQTNVALWKKRNALDEQDKKRGLPPLQYRTAAFPQFNYKGTLFTFEADVERFVKHFLNGHMAINLGPKTTKRAGKLIPFAVREISQQLRAHSSQHLRLQKQLGLTALEDADRRAWRVAFDAFKKMCETAPRTMAGFAALLSHLRMLYKADGLRAFDDGRGNQLFATLEAAAQKLAAPRSALARRALAQSLRQEQRKAAARNG